MPDHLIGIGNGVMAVSRTFTWWSTCTACVICAAPNARTVHLLYAHAVTIAPTHFTPTHFNLVQSTARNKKKTRGAAGATGINMVSLIPLVIVFVTTKEKAIS